jgi:2-C-methyl-D-erythritol 4-phosphate cytidylyltransferase
MGSRDSGFGTARVSALIPAAGSGERLGMGAKALLELRGKTLLERSIAAFRGVAHEIVVALPEVHLEMTLPEGVKRVSGGATRQQSVLNLLEAATGDVVLIHDAARPFLPREVIERVLSSVLEIGAATAALPAADTLVLEREGDWGEVLNRSVIRAVQTPQGFRRELLLEAHERARLEGVSATDDAGLVARLGHPVGLALGDERLFKVTKAGDWALATAFAAVWDEEDIVVAQPAAPSRSST